MISETYGLAVPRRCYIVAAEHIVLIDIQAYASVLLFLQQTLHRLPAIYVRNMHLALISPVLFNTGAYQETSGRL